MAKYFGTTVVDIIRTMPKRFKSGEAKDINIIIGYACQGEGGGKWKVTISRDKIDIQGVSGDLTGCTAEIHAADEHTFIGTTLGKIAAADALVSGKLRVVGDMNILGTILPKIFSPYTVENTDDGTQVKAEELITLKVINSIDYRFASGPVMGRWFAGLKEKKFLANKCPSCGRTQIPPREICAFCRVRCTEYVELGPKGTITLFDIIYYASPDPLTGSARETPYATLFFKLDGASPMDSFAMDTRKDLDRLKVGARIRPVWAEKRTGSFSDILYFEIDE